MINEYDVWFSILEISNKNKIYLLNKFKTTEEIWNLTKDKMLKENLNEDIILKILDINKKKELQKHIRYMENKNIQIISCKSKLYPNELLNIENFSAFLYVRGNIENLYDDCVAIVGSRQASDYGKSIARKFAKEIADKNVNIVSGLAIGIDKYAHLGALDSKIGKTIAVLGTGVSDEEIYPYENKKVFERILESGGTIISEFKLGTKPEKYNFPLRNRIISGLSKKIIIVEAKEKSGSLITVDYALEQGKEVYAVPGNITSINSAGTNKIISEGAFILSKSEDIF